jgi:hypothetical protein
MDQDQTPRYLNFLGPYLSNVLCQQPRSNGCSLSAAATFSGPQRASHVLSVFLKAISAPGAWHSALCYFHDLVLREVDSTPDYPDKVYITSHYGHAKCNLWRILVRLEVLTTFRNISVFYVLLLSGHIANFLFKQYQIRRWEPLGV